MIVISGIERVFLIFRGVCLDNDKCECSPFYSGSSCGTFEDCPSGLDSEICETLKTSNLIQSDSKENNGGFVDFVGLAFFVVFLHFFRE